MPTKAETQKECYGKRGCGAVGKDAPPLYHRPRRSFLNGAATVMERTSASPAVGSATAFLRVNAETASLTAPVSEPFIGAGLSHSHLSQSRGPSQGSRDRTQESD
jgi:hypothetical protein